MTCLPSQGSPVGNLGRLASPMTDAARNSWLDAFTDAKKKALRRAGCANR